MPSKASKKKNKARQHEYETEVVCREEPLKRDYRGRPRKDEEAPTATIYRVRLVSFLENLEEIEHQLKLASTFILITNWLD
ncbi:hypothetical protein D1B31_18370 [Neobacillus notoginsengisoli]|uniref:Uncharacterized protein n=2 Tax=Neobacillus notoginsengisoli TaxID=1578198 RepID=A0A417YQ96_9BACI|nr:hypothetical protein D1B31_18370 [Neobacillus notoginsengisoli]